VETSNQDRIRELCASALIAEPSELEPIMKELRDLLHEHNRFVWSMAKRVLSRFPIDPASSSNAAD